MELQINVKTLCEYAMFESDGELLRAEIENAWTANKDCNIILDFTDVDMYATMFFNASIGWLVLHYGKDIVLNQIKAENLTPLGQETWKHSFDNAVEVANDPQYQKILSELDTNTDD